ncbi:MAG: hypothetical protein P4M11_03540 [Candidatus Pacebacteria bacterium]|nr:hypothetical protein [Candidatus Paceibacterota bacterium]
MPQDREHPEVRRLLIDLIFEKWWLPALMSPTEHGIVTCICAEESYLTTMLSVIRALQTVLYSRPLEDDSEFAREVNKFAANKLYCLAIAT